jgi:hypothetical protein
VPALGLTLGCLFATAMAHQWNSITSGLAMGIGSRDILVLSRLRREDHIPAEGRVAEIGAQQLGNSFLEAIEEVAELGRLFGKAGGLRLPAPPPRSNIAHGDLVHCEESAPMARSFWEWLGFRYVSIDVEGNEGIELDLNFDEVPSAYRGCFDLVTNYGTTEHVANQLNAFQVIHDLARVGGVMVHHLPLQGMMDHGLVNYNPKFFWALARSNRYQWLYSNLLIAGDQRQSAVPRCDVPQSLIEDVQQFEPDVCERMRNYQTTDLMALVACKKLRNEPFVPPIDVPNWVRTDNKKLRERYWTIFHKEDD